MDNLHFRLSDKPNYLGLQKINSQVPPPHFIKESYYHLLQYIQIVSQQCIIIIIIMRKSGYFCTPTSTLLLSSIPSGFIQKYVKQPMGHHTSFP